MYVIHQTKDGKWRFATKEAVHPNAALAEMALRKEFGVGQFDKLEVEFVPFVGTCTECMRQLAVWHDEDKVMRCRFCGHEPKTAVIIPGV